MLSTSAPQTSTVELLIRDDEVVVATWPAGPKRRLPAPIPSSKEELGEGRINLIALDHVKSGRSKAFQGLPARYRGDHLRDVAKAAGISETTAYRRLGNVEFRRRVGAVRNELIGWADGRLADVSVSAVETLKNLLDAESENVRLGAARAILDQAGRYTGYAQTADEPVPPRG